MNRQGTWGWLAVGNFLLGGAGAGAYVVSAALYFAPGGMSPGLMTFETLASSALVVLGLLCVLLEAGQKSRSVNVILNLRRSWMSREAGAASLMVLSCLAWMFFPSPYLVGVGFLSAAALVVTHGFVFRAAKAIPSWSAPAAPPLIWTSSLSAGGAVAMMVSQLVWPVPLLYMASVVGTTSAAFLIVSAGYAALAFSNPALKGSLSEDGNARDFILSALVGGALPLVIAAFQFPLSYELLGAVLMLAGSASMKYIFILRIAYRIPVMALSEPGYIFPANK